MGKLHDLDDPGKPVGPPAGLQIQIDDQDFQESNAITNQILNEHLQENEQKI